MFRIEPRMCKSTAQEIPSVHAPFAADGLPQWYALYTVSRHEKRIARHLDIREIACFLPLYCAQRNWNNGLRVNLELPLFPNYIFVRFDRCMRGRVLEIPGVLSIVGGRQPSPLSEIEIESLRAGVKLRKVEPHPYLVTGERVRIKSGPLAGWLGVLLRDKNSCRAVVTVDQIMRSVAVEVEDDELEAITPASIA
jgi:transcription termination/antitermination protein NusG